MGFSVILTSTVVATVISTLVMYYNNSRNRTLQYITAERKLWRAEVKAIAIEIGESNIDNINYSINKLKPSLNAYGINENKDILKDTHIWELIKIIERKKYKNFEKSKEQLLEYVLALIKYEWQKTKLEVNGIFTKKFTIILLIQLLGIISFINFKVLERSLDAYYFYTVFLFMIFLPVSIFFLEVKSEMVTYFSENKKKRNDFNVFRVVVLVSLGILSFLFLIQISLEYSKYSDFSSYFILYSIFAIVAGKIGTLYYEDDQINIEYDKSIKKITCEMGKPVSSTNDFAIYKEELELIRAQNKVECDLYSVIALVVRASQDGKNISLRDVSVRRKTDFSKAFIGASGFPDFVIRERKKDKNTAILGAIEIKYIDIDLEKHMKQLEGHISSYKQIIYTNGIDWRFYRLEDPINKKYKRIWKVVLGEIVKKEIVWSSDENWQDLLNELDDIKWIKNKFCIENIN